MRKIFPSLFLPALILLMSCCGAPVPTESLQRYQASSPQRIAVIGASASAGGSWSCSLHSALLNYISAENCACDVFNFADKDTYTDVVSYTRSQVSAAKAIKPTLVVAIDFLFWFAYSGKPEDKEALFQEALIQLRSLGCPVLVGDLPDLRSNFILEATNKESFPTSEQLESFNATLERISAEPGGLIKLFPAAKVAAAAKKGESCQICERSFSLRSTLWWDRLHPNNTGCDRLAAMTAHVLEHEGLLIKEQKR